MTISIKTVSQREECFTFTKEARVFDLILKWLPRLPEFYRNGQACLIHELVTVIYM